MKNLKLFLVSLVAVFSLGASTLIPAPATAAPIDVFPACSQDPNSEICKARSGTQLFGPNSIWTRIISTVIYLVGAVSVLMIVIGGLRYVLSNGDQSQISSAKNTILYAVIGIVVALTAQAIVSFVLIRI